MDTRFRLTETKYGSPGIYDAHTGLVAAFVTPTAAREVMAAIIAGTASPAKWSWREAHPEEVVF